MGACRGGRRHTFASLFAAAWLGATPGRNANAAPKLRDLGLQLYTVRAALTVDFEGTLARVAALGYREVEFAGLYGPSIGETLSVLKKLGLTAPSGHASFDELERNLPRALARANGLEQQYIVCPSVDESRRRTLDDWKRLAAMFNGIGAAARRTGLSFAYHNHDFEFHPIDGRVPYEILLAETDPTLVALEADVYWMTKAGRDPVAYFHEYPGRFPLLHLKDMARDGSITEVGNGVIDFRRLLGEAARAGVVHCFIEQDDSRDPQRSIETSLRYVERLEF
jgi:sugar phosphate isomerase/epimerase